MAKKTPKPQTAGKPGPAPRHPASKLTLALLAMLCLGVMVQLSALNRQIDAAQEEREAYAQELEELRRTNTKLAEDISRRDDPDLIEEIAREDLGMARPGEKIFIIN